MYLLDYPFITENVKRSRLLVSKLLLQISELIIFEVIFIAFLKIVAPRSHGTQTMALLMMERSCLFLRISIFLNSNHNFLIDGKFCCNK